MNVIIFTHIPKASGTTLNKFFASIFRPEEIFLTYANPAATPEEYGPQLAALSRKEPCPLRIVAGHAPYGLHTLLVQPARYLTILRDPVERLLSDYFYIKRERRHRFHAAVNAGDMKIVDLAERLANLQTRYLGGRLDMAPGEAELRRAQENVSAHYAVAGLTERFEETLGLFQLQFDWPTRGYSRENVTSLRPKAETLAPDEVRAIRRHHELDGELYEFAKRRFATQVEEAGEALTQRVAALRAASRPGWARRIARCFGVGRP